MIHAYINVRGKRHFHHTLLLLLLLSVSKTTIFFTHSNTFFAFNMSQSSAFTQCGSLCSGPCLYGCVDMTGTGWVTLTRLLPAWDTAHVSVRWGVRRGELDLYGSITDGHPVRHTASLAWHQSACVYVRNSFEITTLAHSSVERKSSSPTSVADFDSQYPVAKLCLC